jgi:hypothetical protein
MADWDAMRVTDGDYMAISRVVIEYVINAQCPHFKNQRYMNRQQSSKRTRLSLECWARTYSACRGNAPVLSR